jgi:hypothetical protein
VINDVLLSSSTTSRSNTDGSRRRGYGVQNGLIVAAGTTRETGRHSIGRGSEHIGLRDEQHPCRDERHPCPVDGWMHAALVATKLRNEIHGKVTTNDVAITLDRLAMTDPTPTDPSESTGWRSLPCPCDLRLGVRSGEIGIVDASPNCEWCLVNGRGHLARALQADLAGGGGRSDSGSNRMSCRRYRCPSSRAVSAAK